MTYELINISINIFNYLSRGFAFKKEINLLVQTLLFNIKGATCGYAFYDIIMIFY